MGHYRAHAGDGHLDPGLRENRRRLRAPQAVSDQPVRLHRPRDAHRRGPVGLGSDRDPHRQSGVRRRRPAVRAGPDDAGVPACGAGAGLGLVVDGGGGRTCRRPGHRRPTGGGTRLALAVPGPGRADRRCPCLGHPVAAQGPDRGAGQDRLPGGQPADGRGAGRSVRRQPRACRRPLLARRRDVPGRRRGDGPVRVAPAADPVSVDSALLVPQTRLWPAHRSPVLRFLRLHGRLRHHAHLRRVGTRPVAGGHVPGHDEPAYREQPAFGDSGSGCRPGGAAMVLSWAACARSRRWGPSRSVPPTTPY